MTLPFRFLRTVVLAVGIVVTSTVRATPDRPRNIVVILADDIGYGDLGCYGATDVKTPHVDQLAAQGLRFTDAYAPASMCSPTRYSLMTGSYSFRNPAVARGVLSGDAGISIADRQRTLANLLHDAGYATALIGKWHLGLGTAKTPIDFNRRIAPGPLDRGFDRAFYIPATMDRVPCVFIDQDRVVGLDPADPIAVDYRHPVGNDPIGKDHPELLRVRPSHGHNNTIIDGISRIGWMAGGHAARWKDEEIADRITAQAVRFIEDHRDQPFFLYFATGDVHVPRAPAPRFVGTSGHGTRGDVIQEFDWSVGEVLAALGRIGATDDTLVIVSSDNGGVMDDGYLDGSEKPDPDHACNGILRGYKSELTEGGCRVPFLARWPGHVPVGDSSAIVALIDLMATASTLTGTPLQADDAPDSIDISGALLGRPGAGRQEIVMQGGLGELALRVGDWKWIPSDRVRLVWHNLPPDDRSRVPQLYDLSADISERQNLASREPEKVSQLQSRLEAIRASTRTRP